MVETFGWRLSEEDRLSEEGSSSCNSMSVAGSNHGGKTGVLPDARCTFRSGKSSYHTWWVVRWSHLRVVRLSHLMGSPVIRLCCETDIRTTWQGLCWISEDWRWQPGQVLRVNIFPGSTPKMWWVANIRALAGWVYLVTPSNTPGLYANFQVLSLNFDLWGQVWRKSTSVFINASHTFLSIVVHTC